MKYPEDFIKENELNLWLQNHGEDSFQYSDGLEEEQYLVNSIEQASDLSSLSYELAASIKNWPSQYHLSPQRSNLLRPLLLDRCSSILELGAGCGVITRYLGENIENVLAIEGSPRRARIAALRCSNLENVNIIGGNFQNIKLAQKFDIVTLIGVLEYSGVYINSDRPYQKVLEIAKKNLTEEGVLILAIENKLGLKYFAGCSEDHTQGYFDGIEGYSNSRIKTFGKKELEKVLKSSGFEYFKFLYPFPDYKLPEIIIRVEEDEWKDRTPFLYQWIGYRNSRDYSNRKLELFQEGLARKQLENNGLLFAHSNSFLVIASVKEQKLDEYLNDDIVAYKYNVTRKRKFMDRVLLVKNNNNQLRVKRESLIKEPNQKSDDLLKHYTNNWSNFVSGTPLIEKIIQTPNNLQEPINIWYNFLLRESRKLLKSDTELPGIYVDCTPWNLIITADGKIEYIDKEWQYLNTLPIKFILYRGIQYLHSWLRAKIQINADNFLILCLELIGLKISSDEQILFAELEHNFQERVNLVSSEKNIERSSSSFIGGGLKLSKARQEIAQQWLNLSSEELEILYRGQLGKKHKDLIQSGCQNLPLTELENKFVEKLIEEIDRQLDRQKSININNLLAVMLYRRADQLPFVHSLDSSPGWFRDDYLQFLLDSPGYFQKLGEADNYCVYFKQLVNYFHSNLTQNTNSDLWWDLGKKFVQLANFIFIYFNETNLKDIYVQRAEILQQVLKHNGAQVHWEFPPKPIGRTKIRLGILANHFNPTAETFATLPIYEYISRDFEVILYSVIRSEHPLEKYCQSCANSFKLLPQDLAAQVDFIRQDDLDIIFIATNITVVPNGICWLALHRLARVQITSVASVVTTGMENIDYYISGKLTEPFDDPQKQYKEQLIQLDGTAHCFSFGPPTNTAIIKLKREDLGIYSDKIVFVSGANLFKIVPELSLTWAKIIASVPNSILLLFPFGPHWSNNYPKEFFTNNLKRVFQEQGVEEERLLILAPQPVPNRDELKEYYKLADIYLDSYPFSGTTSLIEPLEVALPIVTRRGSCFRSAMGAALLQAIDLPELIAHSEESYLELAISLGTNPQLRQLHSSKIQQKMRENPQFLDSRAYSAKMEVVFKSLLNKYQGDFLSDVLGLRDLNLIVFPDWSQSEESLYEDFASIIRELASHPDKSNIAILIDTTKILEEDANLFLSSVAMNLLMEEDLDVTEGPGISLTGQLSATDWSVLLPRIKARIILANEDPEAILRAQAETIVSWELNKL